jgi:metal-responsive CopG/Arc/MetJ family transcriptional regulator
MKVAVSIPDPIFAEAEALAKQFGTSRSELYQRALREFVSRHAADPVTRAMNEVVEAVGAGTDEFGAEASRRVLKRVEW